YFRPVGRSRRRRSGPNLLRGERRAEGGQRRLEDLEGRSGRGAQGVLRYVRQSHRFAHRRQGRRNGLDGPAPTLQTRPARRNGLPFERGVWIYGRLPPAEERHASFE